MKASPSSKPEDARPTPAPGAAAPSPSTAAVAARLRFSSAAKSLNEKSLLLLLLLLLSPDDSLTNGDLWDREPAEVTWLSLKSEAGGGVNAVTWSSAANSSNATLMVGLNL